MTRNIPLIVSIMLSAFVNSFRPRIDFRSIRSGPIFSTDRLPASGISLDVNLVATNPDLVISHFNSRKASEEVIRDVSRLRALRSERNAMIAEGDAARNTRKTLSQQIGQLMKEQRTTEVDCLKKQVEQANEVSALADSKLAEIDANIDTIFSVFPNLLDDRIPEGSDDTQNIVVRTWGESNRKVGTYRWHDEILDGIGGSAMDAAARISGARFSVLLGPIARLERAITQYFLDFHSSRGYVEVSVPYIVSRSTLEGTGQLPKFEEDLFKVSHLVAGEDAFLIPTAEVPVTNLYRDQLLDGSELPIRHVCLTPSFRAEAGSYGRDTRGLLRQHQFHKVELVKVCTPETSEAEHQMMVADAEELLQSLNLPFRTVLLCSGDIGFSARLCYDIETWLPGQQAYREISSISNCQDFQARRMSLRYRTQPQGSEKKAKKTTAYPHTLNGSGVAVGRALVAILENYQLEDGSVMIPEKLRPYMGGLEKIEPKSKV